MFNKRKFREDDLESILAACMVKDPIAERTLIKMFYSYAKSICARYAGSMEETEEVLNDGFLKIFSNLAKYDATQPFKAWLRTIMVNTAIDNYRRNQKYGHHVELDDLDVPDLSEDVISRISADEILSLVQQLPPAYRMVFTLYVIDGHNHREIAELLGIKEGTSKSNLQDARKKLQVMIKKAYPHLHLAYAIKMNRINEN